MCSMGVIAGLLLVAPFVDRVGMERVLTCGLALGALRVLGWALEVGRVGSIAGPLLRVTARRIHATS